MNELKFNMEYMDSGIWIDLIKFLNHLERDFLNNSKLHVSKKVFSLLKLDLQDPDSSRDPIICHAPWKSGLTITWDPDLKEYECQLKMCNLPGEK